MQDRDFFVPTKRMLDVATAVVVLTTGDAAGWRTVADSAIAARAECSPRKVEYGWQDLADAGAAEVGRAEAGVRTVRLLPHPLWDAAVALVRAQP